VRPAFFFAGAERRAEDLRDALFLVLPFEGGFREPALFFDAAFFGLAFAAVFLLLTAGFFAAAFFIPPPADFAVVPRGEVAVVEVAVVEVERLDVIIELLVAGAGAAGAVS
jgi:hypothetical protein